MHLPLTPNNLSPSRNAGLIAVAALLLPLLWTLGSQQKPEPPFLCVLRIPAQPVPMVTVSHKHLVITGHCGVMTIVSEQKSLIVLYDELCEMENRTDSETYTAEEQEQFFLHTEKEFAAKYGLTLKYVQQIKEQGRTWKLAEKR